MDTGVNNIVGDKYPTASSGWLKVSKQGTAKSLPHLVLFLLCVCVCVYWVVALLEIQFHRNYWIHFRFCHINSNTLNYVSCQYVCATNVHLRVGQTGRLPCPFLRKETPCISRNCLLS